MIYIGDSKVDLRDQDLVAFLQNGSTGNIYQWPLAKIPDYQQSAIKPFDLGVAMAGVDVPWNIVQYWSLFDRGQEISKFKIETAGYKQIKINASIKLYLKKGLSQGILERIEKAFNSYTLGSGDVDAYAENFLKANPDISPFSFGCSHNYTIEILTDEVIDNNKIDWLRAHLKENQSLRQIGPNERKNGESRPVRGPNELVCPHDENLPIDPANPCDIKKDIEREIDSRLNNTKCADNKTSSWRIARTDYVPDSRWVWGWHSVKIGCARFDLYYPQTELRDRELQFWVSITIPESLILYEKSIRDCAQRSAVATVVLTIIFSDYATAAAKFMALFWLCLQAKFIDPIECIAADVWVETVYTSDWH